MIFVRPQWLWLLAAVPVCLAWAVLAHKRRRTIAAAYPGLAAAPGRRALKSLCFLAAICALALAAAGPRLGAPEQPAAPVEPAPLTLVIALDCSRSMLARDLAPDRLSAAKALVLDVLARLPRVQAGLVGFAGRAWLACPITADRAALALFLDATTPADAPLGGTNLHAALEAAGLALGAATPGAILLVSDGEETLPDRDAAPRPANRPIFTVAVGSALPTPVPDATGATLRTTTGTPVAAGVDAAGLAALARESGGTPFRLSSDAPNPADGLAQALLALPGPEANPDASPYRGALPGSDTDAILLALGIALLLADWVLAPTARERRPAGLLLALSLLAGLLLAPGPALAASSASEKVAQGLAAAALNDQQAALAAFLAARARDPDAPAILFDIGTAYYRLGRFEAARAAFDRAARSALPPLAAKARYNQGNAAYRLGDVAGAIAGYEAALLLDPDDADAKANLDWLRANPTPPPPAAETPDAQRPGQTPGDQGSGADAPSGQTPAAPQGTDDGSGKHSPDAPPQPGPAADPAKAQEAKVPVAAKDGEKNGLRRASAPGAANDPVLNRIPDLPGPPATPVYTRPTVEKDW
ncbi:VWA domain-containing protein [Desulfovibrio aerotolerans]|uniref:VWA domain-containing protein n=1 Tax=Solidesulfovibrio aerotolerans TaxID=295255 RepID=A0A7C9NH56_9BACT|nr:VWA domain-containing protein [Solidesulfovibrio aerotolerans]MYL81596.1 VWA domain-containing protein [Solidesulfovibrio aerotolerans]